MPELKVFITELETKILRAFWNHLYLTNREMADILRNLADKLEK